MEISETHSNGAKITVKGWNARKVVDAWREAQNALAKAEEPADGEPRVKGVSTSFLGGDYRRYDSDSYFTYSPVPRAFGFVPNELNWRLENFEKGVDTEC